MAPTSPIKKVRSARPKLTASQKASRHEKRVKLAEAVSEAREEMLNKVKTIADGNARSSIWVKKQLFIASSAQKRAPNAWNGFIKGQLQLYNSKRPLGSRAKLTDFLASDEGMAAKAEWDAMPDDEKEMYREEIENLREARHVTVRQNPRAALVDVNQTFKNMDHEWTAIENRTGGEGIFIFVWQSLEQIHAPKVHYTPAVKRFFKDTLNLEPEELALRMESYLVGGQAKVKQSATRTLTSLISTCRKLIQDGLDHIVQQEKIGNHVPMNYKNYELKIVEEHGLELIGWPQGRVRNPGKVGGRTSVTRLLAALRDKSCQWVKLDPAALDARIARCKAAVYCLYM